MSPTPEFSHLVRLDTLGAGPRRVEIKADAAERTALAARFGLLSIERLEADAMLRLEAGRVWADGRIVARAVQACVATGDPVPARIDEPFALRFDPAGEPVREEELELDEADLDILPYDGGAVDLGEAVAQGFALALDPFPRSPSADEALRAAGVRSEEEAEAARIETSPFAALKGLKPSGDA